MYLSIFLGSEGPTVTGVTSTPAGDHDGKPSVGSKSTSSFQLDQKDIVELANFLLKIRKTDTKIQPVPTEDPSTHGSIPAMNDDDSNHLNKGEVLPETKTDLAQLIHKLKPVFDSLPLIKLESLKEYASSGKAYQFEGFLEMFYDGNNSVDVLNAISSLKDHFDIVLAMLKGAIMKKHKKPMISTAKSSDGQYPSQHTAHVAQVDPDTCTPKVTMQ